MVTRTGPFIFVTALSLVFLALLATAPSPQSCERASILAVPDTTPPVAIISELPAFVSNGTWVSLCANESYDDSGFILSYEWEITFGNETDYGYATIERYYFAKVGTYSIKLTVMDEAGNIGVDFAAISAVLDSDLDALPDWWEDKFFRTLELIGDDDPDGDGYSNLAEFGAGTNPMVFDAQPQSWLEENMVLVLAIAGAAAAVAAVAAVVLWKRHKRKEKQKIEYAIEIERALQEEK